MTDKPVHQHDCAKCIFLASNGRRDLYFHPAASHFCAEIVQRYGAASDYSAWSADRILDYAREGAPGDEALLAAYWFAKFKGLI